MFTYNILVLEPENKNELIALFTKYSTNKNTNLIKVTNYNNIKKKLDEKEYDLLLVNLDENNHEYVKIIKKLRDNDYWVPVCFYSGMDAEHILNIMNGKNCLTVFPKNIDKTTFIQKIQNILFIISPEGREQLKQIKERINKIYETVKTLNLKLSA